MKKSFALIVNLAYFFCYVSLLTLLFSMATKGFGNPSYPTIHKAILAIVVIPTISSYLGMYFWVFPKYIQQQQWIKSFLIGSINLIIAVLLGAITMSILFHPGIMFEITWVDMFIKFNLITLVAFINSIMAWVIHGFITWFNESKLKQELTLKNKEMEIALLKSKMDPHFLFNSLNNIDALIQQNAALGSAYINKLSSVVRFMLYETQKAHISLSKEIDYLNEYIDLQSIRTSNKELVAFSKKGDFSDVVIAPVLFIPFVENAFKHLGNKKEKEAIQISIQVSNGQILFSCSNRYEAKSKLDSPNSMGNSLIKKRLEIFYPNKHELIISQDSGVYSVKLILDVE